MPIQKAPPPTLTSDGLTCFSPLSSQDVLTLVTSSLLQNISHDILPFLTTLINSSHTSGLIPAPFKTATIEPILKNTYPRLSWHPKLQTCLSSFIYSSTPGPKHWSSPAWTTATRSWLDSATQPKCNQNVAACLVFNLPKFSNVTPLPHDLHWLRLQPASDSRQWCCPSEHNWWFS